MENLVYKNIDNILRDNLIRIGDLINFDGPLLTLYEDGNNGNLYLLDWVDNDSQTNRWLVYRVKSIKVLNFLKRKISQFELFFQDTDPKYHIIDIHRDFKLKDSQLIEIATVPDSYTPNRDVFFDIIDCPSFERIQNFILKSLPLRTIGYRSKKTFLSSIKRSTGSRYSSRKVQYFEKQKIQKGVSANLIYNNSTHQVTLSRHLSTNKIDIYKKSNNHVRTS
ncbi:MAG: hypothetical protein ACKVOU_11270 [Cytophagales bacterium]